MKLRIVMLFTLISGAMCQAQSFSEVIKREMSFEKKGLNNALVIANINGNVTVSGYEGDKVMVEVTRTITGKTTERLETGKKELQLGVMDLADTLVFFVEGGCNHFGKKDGKRNKQNNNWDYGYNWNGDRCNPLYEYKLNFVVKVPNAVHLILSTINDGDVIVANVKGVVSANNINGNIKLTELSREASASTINGDVDITYFKNPEKDCRFYSLNGDINAHFQKGLAANMKFESFNGDLFTNVAKLEKLPVAPSKEQKGDLLKYKINGNSFKIGNGGALLDFETFNGDVYIKE